MSERDAADEPFGPFHAHELLHTASLIADTFERHVVDHRYTQADGALKEQAEKVSDALWAFYQAVGQKSIADVASAS